MNGYQELKNEIIKELFKDEEYADFLCGQNLADISMIDMICTAPISLKRKAEILKELSKYQTANEEDYFCYKTYYNEIQKALDALTLKENEIFLLVGYEKGIREPKQFCVAPSKDVKMVTEYIKREYLLGNEYNLETCNFWFKLEKWHDTADGEKFEDYFIGDMNNDYTYTLLNGELCYFDNRSDRDKYGLKKQRIKEKLSLFYSGSSLNLPTPWKEGDVLEISATPFTLTAIVVVLANSTKYCDCCLPACLYLTKRDLGVGALKHSHIYNMTVYENISPLFFVKRFTGKLNGEEKVLKMISDYVKDNRERGEEIFDMVTHTKHNIFETIMLNISRSDSRIEAGIKDIKHNLKDGKTADMLTFMKAVGSKYDKLYKQKKKIEDDKRYIMALEYLSAKKETSISDLQRHFGFGYNRAASYIADFEQKGYISASNGGEKRKVLITAAQFNKKFKRRKK